ncbi:zinc-binding dehydrogenase [Actinomadura fulvescens]|uniref:Zinc-binding dehydrogenase n=2 Tax=Actinomadura fulvescens TaxID=46160 RepID=A0ABP6CGG4_9ACTN
MRAVQFDEYGDPGGVLRMVELDDPEPGPGEVRARITLRPINPADVLFVQGRYGRRARFPSPVGFEAAGVVDRCGPGVTLTPGTRVALDGLGTWQDYAVVPEGSVVALPAGVTDEAACQMMINPFTALLLLRAANLAPGDWLLLSAGASAVARMVLKEATKRGARCVSVVRHGRHAEELADLGAKVVHGTGERFAEQVREATKGEGAAVALDAVGGPLGARLTGCLRSGGRLIVYGMLSGEPVPVAPADLVFRTVTVEGFWLPERLGRLSREERDELATAVLRRLESGDLAAPIEAVYSLADFDRALAHDGQSDRSGKILLAG